MKLNDINEYDTVKYVGKWNPEIGLFPGEIGVVVDDYQDGNVEVEFSFPDGSTWLMFALPKGELIIASDQDKKKSTFSRDIAFPLITSYEAGKTISVKHPETGEHVKVGFDKTNGTIVLSTLSLGKIMEMLRPIARI